MGKLERIIIHHSAGQYKANADDMSKYHDMIEYDLKTKTSKLIHGKRKPEDNISCSDGVYAEHCGGLNTGSIGIAACCHLGYEGAKNPGKFPIQQIQFELMCKQIAVRCKQYNIPLDDQHVRTHAEVGWYAETLKSPGLLSQNIGKIDFIYLSFKPELQPHEIGNYIRSKVKYYLNVN